MWGKKDVNMLFRINRHHTETAHEHWCEIVNKETHMTEIIIGTTPTIIYKFKIVSPADLTKAILTIKCAGQIILEKTLVDAVVGENSLSWTLTQQETLNISTRSGKMMLNWLTNSGTRGASAETAIMGVTNHKREVI